MSYLNALLAKAVPTSHERLAFAKPLITRSPSIKTVYPEERLNGWLDTREIDSQRACGRGVNGDKESRRVLHPVSHYAQGTG